jgi:beta-N-acetylhexosaminidase
MTPELRARIAGLLCVGFRGTEVPSELSELVARGVRSVVLFSRNVTEPEGVLALTSAIKRLAQEPIALAVDQEGGLVQRLRRGFSRLPALRALGASGDARLATQVGTLLGRELRAVGVDWDFAPVLDVDTNPNNPVIGARALGSDPALVAQLGTALAAGLERAGVAACGKHFPGHGDTALDSHLALPKLEHSLERLERVELVPFRAAAAANIASIMTAHVVFAPLDAGYPATLSAPVLNGFLRERLRYRGLVVSDDLEMKAIIEHFGIEDAIVRGLLAGIDVFLVCHSPERMHAAIDALIRAVEAKVVPLEVVEAAIARQRAFAQRWAAPAKDKVDPGVLQCSEHLEIVRELERFAQATTGHDPTER